MSTIPSFVINLDRSSARLLSIRQQFASSKLDFIRVSAVDAQKLDDTAVSNLCVKEDSLPLTKPEVACFLSHRKCWQLISEGENKYAAIFEDDIVLSKDAYSYLVSTDWIKSNIDVIKIETYNDKTFLKRWGSIKAKDRKLFHLADFHTGAAGYIISKEQAQHLLFLTESYMPCPVDHYLFNPRWCNFSKSNIRQLVPAICVQDDRKDDFRGLVETTIPIRAAIMPIDRKKLSAFGKLKREILRPLKKVYRKILISYMVVPFR